MSHLEHLKWTRTCWRRSVFSWKTCRQTVQLKLLANLGGLIATAEVFVVVFSRPPEEEDFDEDKDDVEMDERTDFFAFFDGLHDASRERAVDEEEEEGSEEDEEEEPNEGE